MTSFITNTKWSETESFSLRGRRTEDRLSAWCLFIHASFPLERGVCCLFIHASLPLEHFPKP